jgi:hypothetical protein
MASSPAERRAIARRASNTRWANEDDWSAATAAARANGPGSIEYWIKRVDPDGVLDRATAVKKAMKAKAVFYDQLTQQGRDAKAAKAAEAAEAGRTS